MKHSNNNNLILGNRLIDAELISIGYELTNILPVFNQKNLSFRLNHTSLLKAILINHNVPTEKYNDVFAAVLDFTDQRISKFQLHSTITVLLGSSRHSATSLIDILLTEIPLGGPRTFSTNGSNLRNLIKGHSEASKMARAAMEEIENVVSLSLSLGVSVNDWNFFHIEDEHQLMSIPYEFKIL